MGRKQSTGLRNRNGIWHIEKQILGHKICESTGTGSLKEAELILARRIEAVRQATIFGVRPMRTFREAATRYLEESMHLRTVADMARHLRDLDPYIGDLPLNKVHLGTLESFIQDRKRAGVKNKTVNLALSVVRRILNLASRLWRDEAGLTWLETAPLIQMLSGTDSRRPYPLSWDEQRALFQELPDHLATMCLFKVNTGCREQEVCRLRWDWEVAIPELNTSVFIIPDEYVKNGDPRLVILNRVAQSVVDSQRGIHPQFVFTYKGHPVTTINNNGWKAARKRANLTQARVHDLKHTFGRRLRAAGVPNETRKVLLGHRNGDITTHYSAPELQELLEAANRVCEQQSGKTPALVVLKEKVVAA